MTSLAWINAIWRVPLILSATGVMATISVLCSLVDGTGRSQHWCARNWSKFALWVSHVEVEMSGLEHLDPRKSYVFVSNHLSIFDIWAFLGCLPFQFRFVAKASLFRWPFLGWHLKRSGNIAVDRHHPQQALRRVRSAAETIRRGISIVIFPEGMRTWGGEVAPFKRGSFLLAQQARVPVVPVTLVGSHRLLPRGSLVICPGRMQMIIHPALEYEEYGGLDLGTLAEKVRNQIAGRYQRV